MIEVTTENAVDVAKLVAALTSPFDPADVKWKPQSVKGNRALAMAFIDARHVMDRLDSTVGVAGWQDDYEIQPAGSVVCRLSVKVGGDWLRKVDVGSPSEQPDAGDKLKAAFSDALKRAAVKFGVGRYLYRLQAQWTDYDPVKKQFVHTPQLPAFALPKSHKPTPAARQVAQIEADREKVAGPKSGPPLPSDGDELHRRLREYDAKLASQRLCGVGSLLSHVAQAGAKAGYGEDIARWNGPAIPFAVEAVKEFEGRLRTPALAK